HPVGAVPVRPELRVRAGPEGVRGQAAVRDPGDHLAGVEHLDIGTLPRHVRDDEVRLRQVRAARGVADDPAGAGGLDGAAEALTLQPAEADGVLGLATPPGSGPTP